ncbi:hypothetical protein EAI_15309 [Harpegnathos saltator]|uniref:Uncharacterized protein n=1 Tax=Harpegnathos saltator TaxID=610380 RepID=E2C313_HARSA|nr:hypothetical protein EAI_15309 [Harpegnathos saltator]
MHIKSSFQTAHDLLGTSYGRPEDEKRPQDVFKTYSGRPLDICAVRVLQKSLPLTYVVKDMFPNVMQKLPSSLIVY